MRLTTRTASCVLAALAATSCSSSDGASDGGPAAGAGGSDTTAADDTAPGPTPVPIERDEATASTNDRISGVLDGFASTVSNMETGESTTIAIDGADSVLGTTRCGDSTTASDAPLVSTDGFDDALRDVRAFAEESIFRDEFIESDDGTSVTYRLDPLSACADDTECVSQLTDNPLRFVVNANSDDSLTVELLVGEERWAPARFILADEGLQVRGDLKRLMSSVRLFMDAESEADLPRSLAGVVNFSLLKNSEDDFSLSLSIIEALQLEVEDSPGESVRVEVAPSEPTTEMRVNGAQDSLSLRQNLASIDVAVAGSLLCQEMNCGSTEEQGEFRLHLAGLLGQLTTTSGADSFLVEGFGLGADTSFASLDDTRLASLDLNAAGTRTLNIGFSDTDEGIRVTFAPELDLQLAMALTHLSESLRVDMPDWLFDEVFDVSLGGDPRPSILIPHATCDAAGEATSNDQLIVQAGTLTLDSSSLASPTTVHTGMCVIPMDGADEAAHPFTWVTEGVCE